MPAESSSDRSGAAIDCVYPFQGRWLVQNSPADRVPSHGTTLFGSAHAIDFVPVDAGGRSAPFTVAALLRTEVPEHFPGFGRRLCSPAHGAIIVVEDSLADHRTHRGFPSLLYAASQRTRLAGGWRELAGNHVVIAVGSAFVVLCHLQQHSAMVVPGQSVTPGEPVARVGNSGNSTEPHVHVQAVDRLDFDNAQPVPMSFDGGMPRSGEIISV